jgi:hypothetical protein
MVRGFSQPFSPLSTSMGQVSKSNEHTEIIDEVLQLKTEKII